jgi:hypothetical protein
LPAGTRDGRRIDIWIADEREEMATPVAGSMLRCGSKEVGKQRLVRKLEWRAVE